MCEHDKGPRKPAFDLIASLVELEDFPEAAQTTESELAPTYLEQSARHGSLPSKSESTPGTYPCGKCHGTGQYRGLGKCFACNGRGHFKSSPQQRANDRAKAAEKRQQAVNEAAQEALAFLKSRPDIEAWIGRNSNWEFAQSVASSLVKYGSWTPAQLAAVEKCVARDAERARQRERDTKQAQHTSGGLDLSKLPAGRYAVPGGDTRLKVLVDHGTNKWQGFIFVKDAAEYGQGKRYGMQRPGQTYRGDIEPQLRAILADPRAASMAYGKLVGQCGVCGRALEDETSVELGIGPVCRGKMGW